MAAFRHDRSADRQRTARHILAIAAKLTLLVVICLLTAAWSSSWESIRSAAGDIQSVQAAFTQEKHLQILAKPLTSNGILIFAAPDRLRWEYRAPLPSILVMDAGRVQRFVKTGTTWTEDASAALPAMSFVMQEIGRWMKGRFDENPDFDAKLEPDGRIVLTPRKEALATVIQKIDLQLAETPGVIDSVTVFEDETNFTRLIFTGVQVNRPIDPAMFRHHS
jgi:outer membrane lipoprotein-sorting protein